MLLWLSIVCVVSYLCVCLCLTVLVNSFLNEFAISVGEVIVFSLKLFFLCYFVC